MKQSLTLAVLGPGDVLNTVVTQPTVSCAAYGLKEKTDIQQILSEIN